MTLIEIIDAARARGARSRPRTNGFPHYAEALREAGIMSYSFDVPSASAVYRLADGSVLYPGQPLRSAPVELAPFDEFALVEALRRDQAGESTFPEFVVAAFAAGVVRFTVDTGARTCTYVGAAGERYVETYAAVTLPALAEAPVLGA